MKSGFDADRVTVSTKFALYAVAFVFMTGALLGGWVGHSAMEPKIDTAILTVCEKTGGLLTINCW